MNKVKDDLRDAFKDPATQTSFDYKNAYDTFRRVKEGLRAEFKAPSTQHETDMSGLIQKIERIGLDATPNSRDDEVAADNWRIMFMQAGYATPERIKSSLKTLALADPRSELAHTMATTIAVVAYKNGKEDWHHEAHTLPIQTITNLYKAAGEVATNTPAAHHRNLAHPVLALIDMFHTTGQNYGSYGTDIECVWNSRVMQMALIPMIDNDETGAQPFRDLCRTGVKKMCSQGMKATDVITMLPFEKPAPKNGAGFIKTTIPMEAVRD